MDALIGSITILLFGAVVLFAAAAVKYRKKNDEDDYDDLDSLYE